MGWFDGFDGLTGWQLVLATQSRRIDPNGKEEEEEEDDDKRRRRRR